VSRRPRAAFPPPLGAHPLAAPTPALRQPAVHSIFMGRPWC